MTEPILLWYRLDLRLNDHPALAEAAASGRPVLPVFIWEPEDHGKWPAGEASQWWLHHSLERLAKDLKRLKSRLVIRRGPAAEVLRQLVEESGASSVWWTRRYEPSMIARDTAIKAALTDEGIDARSFAGSLLFEPTRVATKTGKPYQVFTPFWKQCLVMEEPREPLPSPTGLSAPSSWPEGLAVEDLALLPTIDWAGGLERTWTPGEQGALDQLHDFLEGHVRAYKKDRDLPGRPGTSRLSPHLHFGEISPHTIWHATREESQGGHDGAETYLREIGWREFAYHLLYHFPHTTDAPLRKEFKAFPWRRSARDLKAWQRGRTGYPVVDAGMRELWETGWMHNRVRMIAASFLVKHLRLHWREGASWFWDTLVDADLASNTLGWQWTAGCGADAAPYFRVFNPIIQGKKFDTDGAYVRRFVPELAALPDRWIHEPWNAPEEVVREAGVVLGKTYPHPMVDHGEARDAALAAYNTIVKPKDS